jgi:hypothetical protein
MAYQLVLLLSLLVTQSLLAASDPLGNWTLRFEPESGTGHFTDIAYQDGVFVAAREDSTIAVSTNGLNWEIRPTDLNLTSGGFIRALAFGNGYHVGLTTTGFAASQDLTNWTHVSHTMDGSLTSIAFGNDRFVAVGPANASGKTVTIWSTDGSDWHGLIQHAPYLKALENVRFINGSFHAVAPGIIVSSQDGLDWSGTLLFNGLEHTDIAGIGDLLTVSTVNADGHSSFLRSTNRTQWVAGSSWIQSTPITHLINGAGYFMAVAPSGPGSTRPYTSTDGSTWVGREITTNTYALNAVAFGKSTFVLTGHSPDNADQVAIFQSDPLPLTNADAALMQAEKHLGLFITGAPGRRYTVEVADSPDDLIWTPVVDLLLPYSPYFWVDDNPSGQSSTRVYRVLTVE